MNNNIVKTNKNYTYDILKNDLQFLNYEYPLFKINYIGKSTLNENIIYIKLGEGNKKLFINASHHANEWMTSLITMMFIEKYLNLYKNKKNYKGRNIEELWNRTSIYIVPMVNPDGVGLCLKDKKILNNELYKNVWEKYINNLDDWKANIRGVDLKNYQPVCKVLWLLIYKTSLILLFYDFLSFLACFWYLFINQFFNFDKFI